METTDDENIRNELSKQKKEFLEFLKDIETEYQNKHFSMVIHKIKNKILELTEMNDKQM